MSIVSERIIKNRIKKIEARKKILQSDLDKAVYILTHYYHVRRIILFGSMVTDRITPDSDVDIAVEGLGDRLFKAIGHVLRECKTEIDIKPFECLNPQFKKLVSERGKLIYESGE